MPGYRTGSPLIGSAGITSVLPVRATVNLHA
jgi:hypothetical protein